MPIWIITLAARAGIPPAFRKAVAYLALAVLLVIVIGCGIAAWNNWRAHDNTAFADSRDKDLTIAAANRVINATNEADANQMARDKQAADNDRELHDEAVKQGTAADVGPGTRSVLERMRQQQQAGHRDTAP